MEKLRNFQQDEISFYKKCMADSFVLGPYLNAFCFSMEELLREYKNSNSWNSSFLTRFLYVNEKNNFLGFSHFWKADLFETHVEIGWVILPEYRNKGYGVKLVRDTMRHAFLYQEINRVQSITSINNKGVLRIWKNCGFKIEGCLRKFMTLDDNMEDCFIASILREEWENAPEN